MYKNLSVRSTNRHIERLVVVGLVKPNLAAIFLGLGAVGKFVKSVKSEALDNCIPRIDKFLLFLYDR